MSAARCNCSLPVLPALLAAALLAGGCAAPVPRDVNGTPATARLSPDATTTVPLTVEQLQQLDALNQQILHDQEAAIRQQQAYEAAYRSAYAYPNVNWNLFYGGWGGGHWGAGFGFSSPGYWGGYPYWW
ncbi:hypothetical protein [Cupriavidus pinatubonensis]|uniref:Lipoprotein n=1 Tax=Cupriavidus pinatubonensis TaxID=248026 RepID=A0ABN7ZJ29_9BURK|nr:hypothetical protein [Cupriavidus pinatubonensis]CAG9184261.1 hypothetical protein LMG23994_05341 [Cupriavidus pinatubonensis]